MLPETIDDLQALFSEKQAYVTEKRLSGDVYVFPETYIRVLRESFVNDCLSKMGEEEYQLTMDFIEYQNTGAINNEAVVELDKWLVNIVNCEPNPVANGCFNEPDHTYNDCGV